jgi:hypothetical protein
MSSPKRGTITLLIILSFTILSLNLPNSLAWTPTELTSNPNNIDSPTIDGILDESWNTIGNHSFHSFDGGRGITLYVQHVEDSIYILVEVRFKTDYDNETISLYLSNSTNETETDEIFDKKQITLFNSTDQGNESSIYSDYYLGNEELYILDSFDEGLEGAAKIGNGTDIHRYYEFKIQYQPSNDSISEDSSIKIFEKISIKIGINNTAIDESVSEAISIQIGPKGISTIDGDPTEYDFDTELYMMIVLISVSVIFGVYGIILISYKAKNPKIKLMEDE